jgi:hypothetical protein
MDKCIAIGSIKDEFPDHYIYDLGIYTTSRKEIIRASNVSSSE